MNKTNKDERREINDAYLRNYGASPPTHLFHTQIEITGLLDWNGELARAKDQKPDNIVSIVLRECEGTSLTRQRIK